MPELEKLQKRIKHLEGMTWGEILRASRGSGNTLHHEVEIEKICADANRRLRRLRYDDLDTLFSLSVNGRRRLWGKRVNEILYIVWWDPHHTVCPSLKD